MSSLGSKRRSRPQPIAAGCPYFTIQVAQIEKVPYDSDRSQR